MNGIVLFFILLAAVIILARIMRKIFPPDYHQRVEDKYNNLNENEGDN